MENLNEADDSLLNSLKEVLGPKGWRAPEAAYLTERRGLLEGRAALIARPADTQQVAACVRLCAAARVGIVPWGGGTGLAGGQVKPEGAKPVVIALDRMRGVNAAASENAIIAEAGATLQSIQEAAKGIDRLFPLSYASEGTASIGGALAVNSGGLQALRYGVARDLCLGVEVVTAQGEIWNGLSTLRKDNTGYDLRNLFIGSEGTLGIITGAALKLFPLPAMKAAAFIAVPGPVEALELLHRLNAASGGSVSVAELIPQLGLDFVLRAFPDRQAPLNDTSPWYFYSEIWGSAESDLSELLTDTLGQAMSGGLVTDAAIARNEAQLLAFRALREGLSEAQKITGGASIKHDVSLPLASLPDFLERAAEAVTASVPGARPCPFGHLGDGNIHYNISQPEGGDAVAFMAKRRKVNEIVHDLVLSMQGSISAEHGIGRLKREANLASIDPVRLAMMRSIKKALDPAGIMNPGAVL